MKKILALHTGGTISMVQEVDGSVNLSDDNPLLLADNFFPSEIEIISENIFNLPSPHITLNEMLILKNRVQRAAKEGYNGVVITHGTDTLEETAYFLDLTLKKKFLLSLLVQCAPAMNLARTAFTILKMQSLQLLAKKPKSKGWWW